MNPRLRAYGQLVRLPNLVTAMADSVAGYFFAGGSLTHWPTIVGLAVASVSLYAGGVALNDVCDAGRDARARPDRPIPAGLIARQHAGVVAVALLVSGCLFAAMTSQRALPVALLLATAIVLYDTVTKSTPIAPFMMGLCRTLNLALGITVATATLTAAHGLASAAIGLYVTSVTVFARSEAGPSSRARLVIGTAGVVAATLCLSGLDCLVPVTHRAFHVAVALLACVLAMNGLRAIRDNCPTAVGRTVGQFVIALVIFDACLVWSTRGPDHALLVAALVVPAVALTKWFRVS